MNGRQIGKIRAIALDLEVFSITQVMRVTTLIPSTIRAELQRMEQEGFLTSEPIRAGDLRLRYRLTDDPEKRLALVRSIEQGEIVEILVPK